LTQNQSKIIEVFKWSYVFTNVSQLYLNQLKHFSTASWLLLDQSRFLLFVHVGDSQNLGMNTLMLVPPMVE